jgi:hypothetical protein
VLHALLVAGGGIQRAIDGLIDGISVGFLIRLHAATVGAPARRGLHLISEFRQLAGQSPARYLRSLAAQP